MEKEENEKMKALARYGKEFGGYRMIDVPKPTCGPEDIIIEIKAAAICGAEMFEITDLSNITVIILVDFPCTE